MTHFASSQRAFPRAAPPSTSGFYARKARSSTAQRAVLRTGGVPRLITCTFSRRTTEIGEPRIQERDGGETGDFYEVVFVKRGGQGLGAEGVFTRSRRRRPTRTLPPGVLAPSLHRFPPCLRAYARSGTARLSEAPGRAWRANRFDSRARSVRRDGSPSPGLRREPCSGASADCRDPARYALP